MKLIRFVMKAEKYKIKSGQPVNQLVKDSSMVNRNISALATRLRGEPQGEVLFDDFSRDCYSTDVLIYQIQPIGVTIPKMNRMCRLPCK
jgi:hypothetical protein